jgi:hypothetical protein
MCAACWWYRALRSLSIITSDRASASASGVAVLAVLGRVALGRVLVSVSVAPAVGGRERDSRNSCVAKRDDVTERSEPAADDGLPAGCVDSGNTWGSLGLGGRSSVGVSTGLAKCGGVATVSRPRTAYGTAGWPSPQPSQLRYKRDAFECSRYVRLSGGSVSMGVIHCVTRAAHASAAASATPHVHAVGTASWCRGGTSPSGGGIQADVWPSYISPSSNDVTPCWYIHHSALSVEQGGTLVHEGVRTGAHRRAVEDVRVLDNG